MTAFPIDPLAGGRRCTMLGVGPMSVNCVDAAIELANSTGSPLMLIASRRQIDSEEFGKGYVNQWSTADFAQYVRDKDTNGKIVLARDHGGPWQSELERAKGLSLEDAMQSAKRSFKEDIDSGLQLLHIDPSIDIFDTPSPDDILHRVFDLYEYCWSYAKSAGRDIWFEIGTEEQSGETNMKQKLVFDLDKITDFCTQSGIPFPTFVVVQTGTRVRERKNIGSFDSPIRVAGQIPAVIQVPRMVELCTQYGIYLKEHNADYLSDEALSWHPRLGIHAANVAPQFGVVESQALVDILESNNLDSACNSILELSYLSRKWDKWILAGSTASPRERAIIAMHYIFSDEKFIIIKNEAAEMLSNKGIILDQYLNDSVKKAILRYMRLFRLVGS